MILEKSVVWLLQTLLSGREVAAGAGGVEVVGVKAAVAALPRGTNRGAPG